MDGGLERQQESPPQQTASIVLVEDNPADVLLLSTALEESGIKFKLTWFETGELAIKGLSRSESLPDLNLLDLMLPLIQGVELLKAIRQILNFADVPIAILTSSNLREDRDSVKLLGVSGYIQKRSSWEDYVLEVGGGHNGNPAAAHWE